MPAQRLLPIALFALLAAPALAGCVTEIPAARNAATIQPSSIAGLNATLPSGGTNASIPAANSVSLAAPPRWALGDWWRFEAVFDTTVVNTFTLIVADVSPGQYRLVTDNPEVAMWEHIWDMSLVGPISASDLSARQRGNDVKFLKWPLANGTTWKTRIDNVEADATLVGPDRTGSWTTTFVSNNRTYATVTYDPAVRMFTDLDFLRDDFELRVVGSGSNYEGPVGGVLAATRVHEERSSWGPIEHVFNVEAWASRVRVTVEGATERFYGHHLVFVGPDNNHRQPIPSRTCSAPCTEFKEAYLDPLPGRWILAGDFGAIHGKLTLDVTEYRFVVHPFVANTPI